MDFSRQQAQLVDMGFNPNDIARALKTSQGNVEVALAYLVQDLEESPETNLGVLAGNLPCPAPAPHALHQHSFLSLLPI